MKSYRLLALVSAIAIIALVLVGGCAGPAAPSTPAASTPAASTPAAMKTLKVGAVGPLSGFVAPWGINQIRGNEIWAECINDGRLSKFSKKVDPAGGLLIGGDRYKIELIKYDDKFEAGASAEAYKKLALMDEAKFVFPSIMPEGKSLAQLIQSLGMFALTIANPPSVIGPDRPLIFNANDDENAYTQSQVYYALTKHPDAKRIAIISPDISAGRYGVASAWKMCKQFNREVVFNKLYPLDTADYHPFMAAVLDSKPDMIIGACAWPNDTALTIEAAYQGGYKGYWCTNTYVLSLILPRVPAQYVEGFSGGWTYGGWTNSPNVPEEPRWYMQQWNAKHGEAEWTTSSPANYAAARVLQAAMEKADSVDPVKVAKVLEGMDPVPHPMGPAKWTGEHYFGINHGLLVPMSTYELHGGKYVTAEIYNPPYPWDNNFTKVSEIPKIYLDEVATVWGRLD